MSTLRQTAQQLESFLVRQLLTASKAFEGDASVAGSSLTHGLFADTLATAVADAGGMGLAPLIEQSLDRAHQGSTPTAVATLPLATHDRGHLDGTVTSGFGVRADPLTGARSQHTGVDLGAATGTPVPAAQDGVVVAAGERGGYGNAIELAHPDGTHTLYAHLSEVQVAPGDAVQSGETIGLVGQTGRTTGPHLHLEVRKGGHFIDPRVALKSYRLRAENPGGGEP